MKKSVTARFGAALIASALLLSPALAEGDVKKGEKVFKKCKTCHFVDKEKNKVGPHLVGIFGRTAGTLEGFKFSKAMQESGVVWSPETLAEYLKKPKDFIPKTKMVFVGLKKEEQVTDLIAYLQEASKKPE